MTDSPHSSTHRFQTPPFGLRLAAIVCAGIGFYGFLATVGTSMRFIVQHRGPWLPLVADPAGALLVMLAGTLLWLRRRAGIVALVAGVALPPLIHRLMGGPVHGPSPLLVAAAILLAANLKHLHRP